MALELVRILSQWAGVIAFLALFGCFLAATAAVELSRAMVDTADEAFRLARRMALLGGACVLLAGLTSTLYWWGVGVASAAAALGMATGLGLATAAFAVAARKLCRTF
ncbi:MAG TPA: hypothetical protein VFI18_05885 [Gaiellales bacterium]|nr:hypothetical protein [Gaiellales bacterium]